MADQPAKAHLREIKLPTEKGKPAQELPHDVTVDFNPETLRVTYTNTIEGKDQRGGPAMQFAAKSTTKLAVELWFDVTTSQTDKDVRKRTEGVNYFMQPKEQKDGKEKKWVPPAVRFHWGSFKFDGVMDSMDETLEFFSSDGRPLRARVSLSISSQDIQFQIDDDAPGVPPTPGTQPRQQMRQGESVQQAMGRSGRPQDWPSVAAANGIENPRLPRPGQFIDAHAGVSLR
ncbi:hypothetical protein OM076_38770 [Solirubrobacter ginsenosidimutans]|uniref:Contractile injection system tube protein N-terminal domain-containing protein n=1 Tax=Solirubrobacter ginsenosidimutans TaxID=490573 RepID=A0A9X3SAQ7_9ACTN|nr:hypothetical protein [Solirubrobacter ginsenosidimutans]MDA0166273.1 hypothetical protein [Solirubrobacter ginsenosidimutans]